MAKATAPAGIQIDYSDLGQGEPALLMMPAWCMSQAGWAQLPQKLAANRRVLTLDWRGHGNSDKPTTDFGSKELVEDAIAVIESSNAKQIVVFSMHHSGWVAIELRRQLGDKIAKIIHLDWVVFPPPEPYINLVRGLADPNGWQQARQILFTIWQDGVTNPPELVEFINGEMTHAYGKEMWTRSGREIAASFDQYGYPLQALSMLTSPVPTLHVYGQPNDPGYLQAQQEFAANNPWFQVHQVKADSYFSQFDAADEIVKAVEKFINT